MTIKKVRSFSVYKRLLTGVAALAITLQPFASVAHAATSTVNPNSLNGWSFVDDNGNGGSGSFVSGPTGSLNAGSAQLSTSASNQGYMLYKAAYGGTKLADISTLSYQTYVQQGNNTIAPALQLDVDRDVTDGNTTWSGRLIYEPYQNTTVTDGSWQTWNTTGAGKWWFSKPTLFDNTCGQGSPCTFDAIKAAFPNIGVRNVAGGGVGFKAGSGWSVPFVGNVDNFTFNADTYDFESAPPATPANLRLVGANGPFACGGATNVNFITPTWDAVPGAVSYNYRVVVPNGGVYGPVNVGNVTSVSGAFGGQGLSTFSVQAVAADGQTSDWATPCAVSYDVAAPTTPTLLTPANNGYKTVNDFYFDWTDSTDATPVTYEFQSSQNPATSGGVLTTGVWNNIANGNSEQNHLTDSMIHSVGANGTWYWQVRAIDAAGNKSAWSSVWKMTIDMDAPNVSLVSPAGNATVTGTSLTQSWTSTSTDVDHYVYESFNNAAATSVRWSENMGTHTSKTANNVANATFWWRVTAYDHAGNATVSPLWKLTVSNPVPSVSAQDFSTWDNSANGFMGITAGFGLNDFSHVNSITVTLANAAGDIVTNTADPDFISMINANGWTQFSTPFVVSGTLDDTFCNGGPCWVAGAHTWTATDKPTKVTATVVGKNNLGQTVTKTATNTTLAESPSYESLLPADTTGVLGDSTNTPGMGGSQPVATFAAVVNPDSTVELVSDDATTPDSSTPDQTPAKTLGATTNAPSDNDSDSDAATTATGLAWYWWAIIIAAVAGAAWWIFAARRRSSE